MAWVWQTILVVLVAAPVGLYLLLRIKHAAKLRKDARRSLPLPRTDMLSWTLPDEIEPVTSEIGFDQATQIPRPPALPPESPAVHSCEVERFDRRRGLVAATIDASIAAVPSLRDLAAIDWSVADGVRLSAASDLDLSRWSNLRAYVDAHYFDVGEPGGFLNRLVGYVGEVKAGEHLASQGAEVVYNESPNVPGYDLIVDGEVLNVKVGGGASGLRAHYEKYPDIPVVTGTDNIDLVPEGLDATFLASLDRFDVREATEDGLDAIHSDFDSGGAVIPYITAFRSSLEQIGLLVDGRTDLTTAAKNVGYDTAGVGLGGLAGAKLGALSGSFLGPIGAAIGGIIGTLVGAVGGRAYANEFKYAEFVASYEAYKEVVLNVRQRIQSRQFEAHSRVVHEVKLQESGLRGTIGSLQKQLELKLEACRRWQQGRYVAFIKLFPKVLDRVEASLQRRERKELSKFARSSFLRRLIWPRLADIQHRVVRESFRARYRVVSAAKSEFVTLASRTPSAVTAVDGARRIRKFVGASPFVSADFDRVCSQLRQATEAVDAKVRQLRIRADHIVRLEFGRRVAAVRTRFHEVARELSEFVNDQSKEASRAESRLVREAHKVGIDIDR